MNHAITSKVFMGLLFVFVMFASDGRFALPGEAVDEARLEKLSAWLSSDHRERWKDRDLAKSHFDELAVEQWQRSVVSIGRHDPRVDLYNWDPHRTDSPSTMAWLE